MGTTAMDHTALARDLAAQLPGPGHIREVFAKVPRHRFLPDVVWGENRVRHDRTTDPEGWLRAVYTDQALTIQRDDGVEGGRGVSTSSSLAPSVMARMLTAARLEPDHRVLEIGTGTGYNAALLSALLGSSSVATIEIDEAVAAAARFALYTYGAYPTVCVDDGEDRWGLAGLPRYDRLVATCTVSRVPDAWLGQIRGRGRIITPWAPTPGTPGGVLAVLEVGGERAAGRFAGGLPLMWARGRRQAGHVAPAGSAADTTVRVDGDPRAPWLDAGQALMLSLLMPHWTYGTGMEEGAEEPYVWIASTTCASWARLHADGRIERFGERNLVDQAAQVRAWWRGQGEPGYNDFGLTVDLVRGTQAVWLREPGRALWATKR